MVPHDSKSDLPLDTSSIVSRNAAVRGAMWSTLVNGSSIFVVGN